jgi:hypothetical protein
MLLKCSDSVSRDAIKSRVERVRRDGKLIPASDISESSQSG